MSKLVYKVTPVNGYDIEALEGWLEDMAAKGLCFSMTAGPITLFERSEPEQVQIHLEPIQGPVEDNSELNALYEEAGWKYLGIFRGSFFVFSTWDLQARAHTDPEILDYALKRFFRQKLVAGMGLLVFNVFLLAFFWKGWYSDNGNWLRWFPLETIERYNLVPMTLSVIGLFLLDLSYLMGMFSLVWLRRHPDRHKPSRTGWLLAAGVLFLLPVGAQLAAYFSGMDYTPYDLEGSSFITLTDIEGADFSLSGDRMYNMDYISHGNTPLKPESWYFQQYGSFSQFDGGIEINDVPRLEVRAKRYLFTALAKQQVDEWGRVRDFSYSHDGFQPLPPVSGVDQIFFARGEEGMSLLLRDGNTVLLAEYRGDKDLTDHLDRLLETLAGL